MYIFNIFRSSHLLKVKQTYIEHLYDALYYSYLSFKASICFFIHSLFPDLFEFDGSRIVKELNNILEEKKAKLGIK